jgi:hypothetical protein
VPASQPSIISRAQWGANESWRNCGPQYSATLDQGHIHHTAGGNNYTAAQAPGIVRGIYSYHARTLGWCDIGYNFLVDRFGRIYEGRAGGIRDRVIGAHAAGFNRGSFAAAVMGNFEVAAPTEASIDAVVRLFVWKMTYHKINPTRTVVRDGRGYNAIVGHRDVNPTACPGRHLYKRLGEIRDRIIPNVLGAEPFGRFDSATRTGSQVRVRGWGIDPKTEAHIKVHVYVGGPAGVGTGIPTTANQWRPDVGAIYPRWGNNRGFDLTTAVRGPRNEACVYLINAAGPNTSLGCRPF